MAFAVKAAVADADAKAFSFAAQKTMYGGKAIDVGDTVYIFASETHGGPEKGKTGLIARGVVTAVDYSGVAKPEVSSPVYGGRLGRPRTDGGRRPTDHKAACPGVAAQQRSWMEGACATPRA